MKLLHSSSPSGEGKTTMLRLILSLLRAQGEKHGLVQGRQRTTDCTVAVHKEIVFLCATGEYDVFRNNCRKYAKCETGSHR